MDDRSLSEIPMTEIRNLRKQELIHLIEKAKEKSDNDATAAKTLADNSIWDDSPSLCDIQGMIKSLQEQMNQLLHQQRQSKLDDLTHQMSAIQDKVAEFTNKIQTPASDEGDDWTTVQGNRRKAFSDAVRQSVTSALQDERVKCDVVISRAEESTDDSKFVNELCKTMDFPAHPTSAQRLGKKKGEQPRLLKVSFPTAFDARTFIARYDQARRNKTDALPSLRIRSSKTKQERELFAKSSKLAYELNTKAKKDVSNESFSLRDDGSIWKFIQSDDGKWKRDRSWRPPTSTVSPTNATGAPTPDAGN